MTEHQITIARGDGIGPEIMDATLAILEAAAAPLRCDEIEIGEKVYDRGESAGIAEESWELLEKNGVFLKAPITTPQGGGFKSLNVTVRKTLGLFANVRPCRSYAPFVRTKHPEMDLVIIRENEEDLYGGIEHRQTPEVYQCLKLITRPGSEKISRYAFEFARRTGRSKVTCVCKDNIMKLTDGLFRRVFEEIGSDYPEIEKDFLIVDIGAARLADTPEIFDVLLAPNLYGDILSDVAAQIGGSVGLAGSSNVGEHFAMFEAIHGSAPPIAGQGIANPSGLLLAAVQMLGHLGEGTTAEKIHNSWLKTIEDGIHTADIYQEGTSKKLVKTAEFTEAVCERLGEQPSVLTPVKYGDEPPLEVKQSRDQVEIRERKLVGVDVFLYEENRDAESLAFRVQSAVEASPYALQLITNRGVKVWPHGRKETFCTDHWRCRIAKNEEHTARPADIWELLKSLDEAGLDVIKTENLYLFDGERGYSLGQGQ